MAVNVKGIATSNGNGICYKRFSIIAADVAALGAATSGLIALFTLPAGGVILGITVRHTTQFVVGSGTFKVSVGINGSTTLFTAATADLVATGVAATTLQQTAMFKSGSSAAQAVVLECVSSVGNLSTCSAGALYVDVCWLDASTPGL
jgi:hypothetical protein